MISDFNIQSCIFAQFCTLEVIDTTFALKESQQTAATII
jgi:hypothetical protein